MKAFSFYFVRVLLGVFALFCLKNAVISTAAVSFGCFSCLSALRESEMASNASEVSYCFCNNRDLDGDFLIGCEACDRWFHGACVGIDESSAAKLDAYFCKECKNQGKSADATKRGLKVNSDQPIKRSKLDAPFDLAADLSSMTRQELEANIAKIKQEIVKLERELGLNQRLSKHIEYVPIDIPPHCVPLRFDVRGFDFKKLGEAIQFDAIVMDPPWQLASSAPTRGVALGYTQLPNRDIEELPLPLLQTRGFLFIWVINSRYSFALDLMDKWGYRLVDDITWVKATVNRRLAKGHGFYLQHAKETCLVGKKGPDPENMRGNVGSDVIFSERRGQSQKPEEIYELIEQLLPGGNYLEIFARRNNLRNYWVSIGLEL